MRWSSAARWRASISRHSLASANSVASAAGWVAADDPRTDGLRIGVAPRQVEEIVGDADEQKVDRADNVEPAILDHAVKGRLSALVQMPLGRASLGDDPGKRIGRRGGDVPQGCIFDVYGAMEGLFGRFDA